MYSFIKNIKKVDLDNVAQDSFLISLKGCDPDEDDDDEFEYEEDDDLDDEDDDFGYDVEG